MMMFPKPYTYSAKKYLAFIRNHRCIVCGYDQTAPHHEPLGMSGTSIKAPDSHCVPLCEDHHIPGVHAAPKSFWDEHNIDIKMEIIKLLTEYLHERGI